MLVSYENHTFAIITQKVNIFSKIQFNTKVILFINVIKCKHKKHLILNGYNINVYCYVISGVWFIRGQWIFS